MTDRFCIATFERADGARGSSVREPRSRTESIERVRQAADIVEVVSGHTDLRRQGARWTGLCPFHDERTPSFSVDPRRSSTTASAARPAATRSSSSRRRRGSTSPRRSSCWPTATGSSSAFEQRTRGEERAPPRRERLLRAARRRPPRFYARYLWDSDEAAKARALPRERGLGREALERVRGRLSPRAPGTGAACAPSRPASAARSCTAPGSPSAAAQGGIYDRFRGPHHVPAARRARPGARLRRPRDARGPAAEVRQHARDAPSTTRAARCSGSTSRDSTPRGPAG